jgi:hypothetical protein
MPSCAPYAQIANLCVQLFQREEVDVAGKGKKGKETEPDEPAAYEYKLPASARPGVLRETAAVYGAEPLRKKNFRLKQSTIDRAMEMLGTRNETETIEQALEMVVFGRELTQGVREVRGAGLDDVFGSGE